MPLNQRLKIFEAIKGSAIHQSLATPSSEVGFCFSFLMSVGGIPSQIAMTRCQNSVVMDPGHTLDLVRIILQQEINSKIQAILAQYCETHFKPAIANMKANLGEENVPGRALDDVCTNILGRDRLNID